MLKKIIYCISVIGWRGLAYCVYAKLSKNNILFDVKSANNPPIFLRTLSSDIHTYKQIFIDKEYEFLAIKQPRIIIDAGANIGLSAVYFSQKFPKAKIIAIEPESENFKMLLKNTQPYENIIPIQAALWHKSEKIELVDAGFGEWGFMTNEKSDFNTKAELVDALTINDIMERFGIDEVDILKIDIEGAEKEVFGSSGSWITKVNSIIVELHDRMKHGCSRSFYMGSGGFDNEWLRGENVYLSRQDIIAPPRN